MRAGDQAVLIMLIVVTAVWVLFMLKGWLMKASNDAAAWGIEVDEEIMITEAVTLLENEGYEVMTMKRKIPLAMSVTDKHTEQLQSRLFVDHFVRFEGQIYVAKVSKDRQPMQWTGSGVRDRLLIYQLLFPKAAGVLYVDVAMQRIVKIQFQWNG